MSDAGKRLIGAAEEALASRERVTFDGDGLDEVVTCGGAHLERTSNKHWFLEMIRADGSSFCVWFKGRALRTEGRAAPAAPVEN